MKKCYIIYSLIIIILATNPVFGYDNIYEFNDGENVIYSTTVYNKTGQPCLDCECNLTIYKPYPNENETVLSVIMDDKGNGIVSKNVGTNLTYNDSVYPITIVCNDTNNNFGGEYRNAIKVGEIMFDYSSAIFVFMGIAAIFMFASFKLNKEMGDLRLAFFYMSFVFMLISIVFSFIILNKSPASSDFTGYYDIILMSFGMFLALVTWIYFIFRWRKHAEIAGKK